jgi:hypothetical protein
VQRFRQIISRKTGFSETRNECPRKQSVLSGAAWARPPAKTIRLTCSLPMGNVYLTNSSATFCVFKSKSTPVERFRRSCVVPAIRVEFTACFRLVKSVNYPGMNLEFGESSDYLVGFFSVPSLKALAHRNTFFLFHLSRKKVPRVS